MTKAAAGEAIEVDKVVDTVRSLNPLKEGEDPEVFEEVITRLEDAIENGEIATHTVDDDQAYKVKAAYAVFNKHYSKEPPEFYCFQIPVSKGSAEKFVDILRHNGFLLVGDKCKSKAEAKFVVILGFLRHNGFLNEYLDRIKKEKILGGDLGLKRKNGSHEEQPEAKKDTPAPLQFDPAEGLSPGTQFFLISNNKPPNSLLNEVLVTKGHKAAQYSVTDTNGGFIAECVANEVTIRGVVAKSKQLAKHSAARLMINYLVRSGDIPTPEEIHLNHSQFVAPKTFEQFARHICFEALISAIQENPLASLTDTHLAGIVMVNAADRKATLIAMSTGSYSGPQIYNNGFDVRDCDAIVTCKRALQRFLMKEVIVFCANPAASIFCQEEKSIKLKLRPNVSFHLYCNYNPLPGEQTSSLRTKKPVGINKFAPRRFVPLSMVTADKILKWNVMGVQGAILTQSMEPVFLKSIIVNANADYDELHLMLCGRYKDSNAPKIVIMPPIAPYDLNIAPYQPGERYGLLWSITEPDETSILSCSSGFNWDGSPSIISRIGLFSVVKKIYKAFGMDIGEAQYLDIKHAANTIEYFSKLGVFKRTLEESKLGTWIQKNNRC
ncbi:unnamed protein product [Bursaphelenchus xylophilus]|uniref:(pine wood nematode) hypothetical protein n=1 Tax=Bursaphelenchus xylophilus TaxID=6326 RepID=A0A1I7RIL6_BURXY|nr:unnamed protein product [Bursaphelenchus xylophilus]CAG9118883.1 unnamed protein product [Bursaphelenchus xylophilus]